MTSDLGNFSIRSDDRTLLFRSIQKYHRFSAKFHYGLGILKPDFFLIKMILISIFNLYSGNQYDCYYIWIQYLMYQGSNNFKNRVSSSQPTQSDRIKRSYRQREMSISNNGSQLKDPDISGALCTSRIQYSYTQTQCEDGARDIRVL